MNAKNVFKVTLWILSKDNNSMLNEMDLEHLAAILSGDLGEKVQENHQPVMCSCLNPQCSGFIYVYFSIYREHVYPIWLSYFFRGVAQPPTRCVWMNTIRCSWGNHVSLRQRPWMAGISKGSGESCRAKIANVRPPSDVCWFRFAPVTIR